MESRGTGRYEANIAVLMSILMPSLQLVKDHATQLQCQSNAKNLAMAWFMYKDENDGKLVSAMTPTMSSAGPVAQAGWVRLADNWDSNATLEQKQEAMKAGALWPYTGKNLDVYRCPADRRIKLPNLATARSFSIPDGANGEGWPAGAVVVAKRYSDLRQPSAKYIFVEDFDDRGDNQNSWCLSFPTGFSDPMAIWHNNNSTFAFADSEMHRWVNKDFIKWCDECLGAALYNEGGFSFNHPSTDAVEDYRFLAGRFPLPVPQVKTVAR